MNKFLSTLFILFISINAHSQAVDSKSWIEDIDFYQTNLEKYHIDLYNNITKVEFEQDLEQIKSNLNNTTERDVIISLMRLTRKIGDGHTAFSLRNIETHLFPVEIYKIEKKWRVIKTTDKHKEILGKELIAIDGKTIKKLKMKLVK